MTLTPLAHDRYRRAACAVAIGTIGIGLLVVGPVSAQGVDVPVVPLAGDGQAAVCASSTVSGLDPAGDNFLAVRSGPGSDFRKIDELHTGDVVLTCDARGGWIGIFYPGPDGKSGWVFGKYLTALAG